MFMGHNLLTDTLLRDVATPQPNTHPWMCQQDCPLGSRAGLSLYSHYLCSEWWCCFPSSEENWGCKAFPFLSVPSLWHLCLGGCVVWWGSATSCCRVPLAFLAGTAFPRFWKFHFQNENGTDKGIVAGTLRRGHLRLDFLWLPLSPPKTMIFFPSWPGKGKNIGKGRQKPKPGEGIVRRALSCCRWVQVSWLGGVPQGLPGDTEELADPDSGPGRILGNRNSVRRMEAENVLQFFKTERKAASADCCLVSLTVMLGLPLRFFFFFPLE